MGHSFRVEMEEDSCSGTEVTPIGEDGIETSEDNSDYNAQHGEPLAYSLFDDFASPDSQIVWTYMREKFDFDINRLRNDIAEFTDWKRIALINYLRRRYARGESCVALISKLPEMEKEWNKEDNLIPILENDRLLWELPLGFQFEDDNEADEVRILNKPRELIDLDKTPYETLKHVIENKQKSSSGKACETGKCLDIISANEDDTAYFRSYASLDIHRTMIGDSVRTNVYREFILENKDYFAGKCVLDVGCGTGILSMFCAQAGARLVVGVDAAEAVVNTARAVVNDNNFTNIHLLTGKIESLDIWVTDSCNKTVVAVPRGSTPPQNASPFKCDICVSEWMGYGLLYESMLFSVIDARNRFLVPGGLIVPCEASLQVWGSDFSQHLYDALDFWDDRNIYALNLSRLKPDVDQCLGVAMVQQVPCDQIISPPETLFTLNLSTVTMEELQELASSFVLKSTSRLTSLVFSFRCLFQVNGASRCLDTSPFAPPTHWKQVVCHLKYGSPSKRFPIPSSPDQVLVLEGMCFMSPASGQGSRQLSIIVRISSALLDGIIKIIPELNRFLLE